MSVRQNWNRINVDPRYFYLSWKSQNLFAKYFCTYSVTCVRTAEPGPVATEKLLLQNIQNLENVKNIKFLMDSSAKLSKLPPSS